MRKLIAISAILLPLAVMAAQAESYALSGSDSREYGNRAVLGQSNQTDTQVPPESVTGYDLDHRYVDWDVVEAASKGKEAMTAVKNSDDEDGDDGEDDKDDGGEKEEGGGGWDRHWDAPRLG